MILLMVWGMSYWEMVGAWCGDELVHIALRQQSDEDAAARRGGPLLICDTDALATSVWHERYVGAASPEVARIAAATARIDSLLGLDSLRRGAS